MPAGTILLSAKVRRRIRKVSTRALQPLSACTPARTPLLASGTAPTLPPSCLGAVVSPPRVLSSGLAHSEGSQAYVFEALSLSVPLTKKLSVSSAKAAAS